MEVFGIIYVVLHISSGRVYVGQTTKNAEWRWKKHVDAAFRENRQNRIARAIRLYGPEAFVVAEYDRAFSKKELDEMEIKAIRSYNATNQRNGFNISEGGGRTQLFGSENPMFGRKMTPEHKERMVSSIRSTFIAKGFVNRVKEVSEEEREKRHRSLLGNKRASAPKTEEHKRKISEAQKRYWAGIKEGKV